MLGASAVGKTTLVTRFVESVYSESYHTTIGVKIDKKVLTEAGMEPVALVLWDIYGEDEFQQVRMSYLRGASGYLLVVDGTRCETLDKALLFEEKVSKTLGKIPSVIAINKSDLAQGWKIELQCVDALAARGRTVVRTSAKTGEGVETAFRELARAMLETVRVE